MLGGVVTFLRQRIRPATIITTIVAVAAAIGLARVDPLGSIETETEDYRHREGLLQYQHGVRLPPEAVRGLNEAGEPVPDPAADPATYAEQWHVVIVAMDDESIMRLGGTPFSPREHLAVVEVLAELGASAIVFDNLYSETRQKLFPGGTSELAQGIGQIRDQGGPAVSFAWKFDFDTRGRFVPYPPVPELRAVAGEGCINLAISTGSGVARQYRFVYPDATDHDGMKHGLSLALTAYLQATMPGVPLAEAYAKLLEQVDASGDATLEAALREGEPRRLRYYGPSGTIPRVSYADLYDVHGLLVAAAALTFDADIAEFESRAAEIRAEITGRALALDDALTAIVDAFARDYDDVDGIDAAIDGAHAQIDELVADADEAAPLHILIDNFAHFADQAAGTRLDRAEVVAEHSAALTDEQKARLAVLRERVAGKIALIGPYALDLHDLYVTPTRGMPAVGFVPDLGSRDGGEVDDASEQPTSLAWDTTRMYGVEIQATAVENAYELLDPKDPLVRRGITRTGETDALQLVGAVALIAAVLAVLLPPLVGAGVMLLGCLVLALVARQTYLDSLVLMPVVNPMLGAIVAYGAMTITRVLTVDRERRQVDRLFKNYVDRRFVEILKRDPSKIKLGGDRKDITVFFSDVAGFSAIAEELEPEDLVVLLNEYLGAMTDVILEHDGTIDKYIGDAIMAFWNAPLDVPEHALQGCRAALRQRARLHELCEQWIARGYPRVDARMGLNTGPIVHANVGSDLRKNYTLMGDSVNLAARFEPLNKDFNTAIIVGERTSELAGPAIVTRRLGTVQVKGRKRPTTFFELVGLAGEVAQDRLDLIAAFHDALDAYVALDLDCARDALGRALAIDPVDGPSLTYQQLISALPDRLPERHTWTGVFEQTHK